MTIIYEKDLGTQKTVARNSIDEILCEYTVHKFNFRTIKVFPCKKCMAYTSRSFEHEILAQIVLS